MKKAPKSINDFEGADSPPTIDGHTYKTVKIGKQEWFAENLKTTVYANGDAIPYSRTNESWKNQEMGMRCSYKHKDAMNAKYGQFYNWYAVNDVRSLCPKGWRVPTDEDWCESHANSTSHYRGTDQGNKMKSSPSDVPSWNGTNTSGFSALACGKRNGRGEFYSTGHVGLFWSSSSDRTYYAWYRALHSGYTGVYRSNGNKRLGFFVRCVRDAE